MQIKIIESKDAFHGRVFDVRQDRIELPDGRQVQMDIVVHDAAVTMLPIDTDGQIWFIRQYRHAIKDELLELPAGVSERGEDPQMSAQRELREEIGMAAGRLEKLGGFHLAPGYSTEYMHLFLATDLTPSPLPGDETEVLRVDKIPVREALRLAEDGQLQDSKSLIAMFWARPHLERLGWL
jgi:ADP-ribose pyrophosphatase